MNRTHLTLRAPQEVHDEIERIALGENLTRSETVLRLIRLGLDARGRGVESNHELLESLHERLEALDERLSADQDAVSRALASGINDAYQKLFVVLENCFVIDVELLLLLRLSLAKRDPATALEARAKAKDFLLKKYVQFGLKPPKHGVAEPVA